MSLLRNRDVYGMHGLYSVIGSMACIASHQVANHEETEIEMSRLLVPYNNMYSLARSM